MGNFTLTAPQMHMLSSCSPHRIPHLVLPVVSTVNLRASSSVIISNFGKQNIHCYPTIPTMSDSVKHDESDPVRAPLYAGMAVRQQNEYDRLRTQHELHKAAMKGQLIRVPLSQDRPVRVLDSATGDGLWIVDVAKQYPKATFVGTDIVPKHFEQLKDLPSSISFKIQSVLEDWPEEDHGAFDLVHQRYCLAMFSPEKDAAIVSRMFKLVKPGGYIQLVDANLLGYDGGDAHPGMTRMMRYMQRGFTDANMNPAPGPNLAEWVKAAGALDVKEEVLSFPMGCLAATNADQQNTTSNLVNMIDNFAMIGSSTYLEPVAFGGLVH
jgi:SAM-dependent methyltransferase